MLYITFQKSKDVLMFVDEYFNLNYEDNWLEDPLVRKMIQDVDNSTVLDGCVIDSPVLGKISPSELSGGVKALILMLKENRIVWATACGDNCAKWILKIAESKDLTVTLHHGMRFGEGPYEIMIMNTGKIVHNRQEWLDVVFDYV